MSVYCFVFLILISWITVYIRKLNKVRIHYQLLRYLNLIRISTLLCVYTLTLLWFHIKNYDFNVSTFGSFLFSLFHYCFSFYTCYRYNVHNKFALYICAGLNKTMKIYLVLLIFLTHIRFMSWQDTWWNGTSAVLNHMKCAWLMFSIHHLNQFAKRWTQKERKYTHNFYGNHTTMDNKTNPAIVVLSASPCL